MAHEILQGEGAARLLPLARRRLERFREILDLDAWSNIIRVGDARVRIAWSDDEEFIRIVCKREDIYAFDRIGGASGAVRYARSYFQGFIVLGTSTITNPPIPIDDHDVFVTQNLAYEPIQRAGIRSRNGLLNWKVVTLSTPNTVYDEFTTVPLYTGRLRNEDGKIIGKSVLTHSPSDPYPVFPVFERIDLIGSEVSRATVTLGIEAGYGDGAFPWCVAYTGHNHVVLAIPAATAEGENMLYSTDRGVTWFLGTRIADPGYVDPLLTTPRSAYFPPESILPISEDGHVLAVTSTNYVYFSDDYGVSFTLLPERIPDFLGTGPSPEEAGGPWPTSWMRLLCLGTDAVLAFVPSVSDPDRYVRAWRTLDAGGSWQEAAPPRPEISPGANADHLSVTNAAYRRGRTTEKTSLAVSVLNGSDVYVYLSKDSATTWKRAGKIGPTNLANVNSWNLMGVGSRSRPLVPLPVLPRLFDNPVS